LSLDYQSAEPLTSSGHSPGQPPEGELANIPREPLRPRRTRRSGTVTMAWAAPYPPPAVCREFEAIEPGWTRQLMQEIRAEGAHRRRMESAGLLITATIATLVFLIGGGLMYTGHDWGAAIMLGDLVALVGGSVYRARNLPTPSDPNAPPPLATR
jgi:hypothetical protein